MDFALGLYRREHILYQRLDALADSLPIVLDGRISYYQQITDQIAGAGGGAVLPCWADVGSGQANNLHNFFNSPVGSVLLSNFNKCG